MKNGKVLAEDVRLDVEPRELIENLNNYDIKDIIILELTRVGTSAGIDAAFMQEIAGLSKHDVLVGGGIKDMDDIEALKKIGIRGALVATAVHNENTFESNPELLNLAKTDFRYPQSWQNLTFHSSIIPDNLSPIIFQSTVSPYLNPRRRRASLSCSRIFSSVYSLLEHLLSSR